MKAFEWTQDSEGKDKYTETQDILFFPKIMVSEKKEERILRAGIRMPAVTKEKTYSYRCDSCKRVTYVPIRELSSRNGNPICTKCGGHTEPTQATLKAIGDTAKPKKKPLWEEQFDKPFECTFCHTRFRSQAAMSLHVQEKHFEF